MQRNALHRRMEKSEGRDKKTRTKVRRKGHRPEEKEQKGEEARKGEEAKRS